MRQGNSGREETRGEERSENEDMDYKVYAEAGR